MRLRWWTCLQSLVLTTLAMKENAVNSTSLLLALLRLFNLVPITIELYGYIYTDDFDLVIRSKIGTSIVFIRSKDVDPMHSIEGGRW